EQARGDGWYPERRRWQAALILVLTSAWIWFVHATWAHRPARRHRYGTMATVALTIAAFAAARGVSLHQVDSLVHGHSVVGMRVGTIVEYALLVVAAGCAFRSKT